MRQEDVVVDAQAMGDAMVCCMVGPEQYALRLADVRGVARAEQLERAAASDGRVGTIRHERAMAPVYRLASLLGSASGAAGSGQHIVLVRNGHGTIGLLVDGIVRMPRSSHARLLPLPPLVGPTASARFEGLLRLDDTACLVLAPAGLDPDGAPRPAPGRVGASRASRPAGAASDIVVLFSSPALPFRSSGRYALDARRVGAFVQSLPSVAVPGSSRHVKGLAWWRDTAVPILEFTGDGSSGAPATQARYMITRCAGGWAGAMVAFAVDADVAVHRATNADRRIDSNGDASFIRAVFTIGHERIGLLDPEALASAADTDRVTVTASR